MIENNIIDNKIDLVIFDIDGTLVYYDTLNKLVSQALSDFILPQLIKE